LIPKEVVQNAIDFSKMLQQDLGKCKPPKLSFTWEQGIPVDNKIGRILMGE